MRIAERWLSDSRLGDHCLPEDDLLPVLPFQVLVDLPGELRWVRVLLILVDDDAVLHTLCEAVAEGDQTKGVNISYSLEPSIEFGQPDP
jgi:hypothetical protein